MQAEGSVHEAGFTSLRELTAGDSGSVLIGDEPGSDSYADDSSFRFLRTGSLTGSQLDPTVGRSGQVGVAKHAFIKQDLLAEDLLIAKDGPVGSVGILKEDVQGAMISSGVVRVRLRGDTDPYFFFAVMKYGSYQKVVDTLTPKSSSYKHAGRDLLLNIVLPDARESPVVARRVSALARIAVECEHVAAARVGQIVSALDAAHGTGGLSMLNSARSSITEIRASGRLDARRISAISGPLGQRLRKLGSMSLADLENSGRITIRRAQNLQVDAIGFSEKHDDERPGSYRLVEPNMVSWDMTIPRSRWLSCAKRLAVIPDDVVLLSAEGSVGNVTIFREDKETRTISNIHAFVIQATDETERQDVAVWLSATLLWLREKGWLASVAAGGQGGSLGKNYHGDVLLPLVADDVLGHLTDWVVGDGSRFASKDLSGQHGGELEGTRRRVSQMGVSEIDQLRRAAERAIQAEIQGSWPQLAGTAI